MVSHTKLFCYIMFFSKTKLLRILSLKKFIKQFSFEFQTNTVFTIKSECNIIMLHHEDSPEKPQHNMTTSLFLDKLPIMPYTLSFLGKIFRPPPPPPSTPISINFGKADPTMVALAIWKSLLSIGLQCIDIILWHRGLEKFQANSSPCVYLVNKSSGT